MREGLGKTDARSEYVRDHPPPWINSSEKATLGAFLDYLREAVISKLAGLTDEQARRTGVPSGTSLLGL